MYVQYAHCFVSCDTPGTNLEQSWGSTFKLTVVLKEKAMQEPKWNEPGNK
jgi:hypothetical protein